MRMSRLAMGFLLWGGAVSLIAVLGLDRATSAPGAKPGPASTAAAANALPVPVTPVVRRTIPIALEYVGTTEAIRTVTLQAKAIGYLARQAVPDGADIKRGDLLYVLDPRDYLAVLDQNKAQAAKDVAALEYARASQGRNAVLSTQGWVTKDAYDKVTSALHQAESALAADRAAIQTAELNLGYTEIRAPFDGRLGRSQVHEGALITVAGTPFNTLVQLNPIYVTFNPSESDLARIGAAAQRGTVPAEILLGDDKGRRLSGKLAFLDNTVDRATGTIAARVMVDNPDRSLLPGQYVRVRLTVGELDGALLAPQTAVGSSQIGKFVYVVTPDDKADQRYVSLGPADGDLVVVTKGVSAGDRVIVGNLQKLGPGNAVQPQAEAKTGP